MTRRSACLCALTALSGSPLFAGLPRLAGNLSVKLPDGKTVTVAGYKGKVLIVGIILTTCPHCCQTAQILSRIHAELASRGLAVLLAAINPNPDVPAFIKTYKLTYQVGECDYMASRKFMELPDDKRVSAPWLVFVDQQSQIRQQFVGGDSYFFAEDIKQQENNIRMILDSMLPGSAAPKSTTSRKTAPSSK